MYFYVLGCIQFLGIFAFIVCNRKFRLLKLNERIFNKRQFIFYSELFLYVLYLFFIQSLSIDGRSHLHQYFSIGLYTISKNKGSFGSTSWTIFFEDIGVVEDRCCWRWKTKIRIAFQNILIFVMFSILHVLFDSFPTFVRAIRNISTTWCTNECFWCWSFLQPCFYWICTTIEFV